MLTTMCSGLPHHVRASPGHCEPDQLLIREQHGTRGQPGNVRARRLRLPPGGTIRQQICKLFRTM